MRDKEKLQGFVDKILAWERSKDWEDMDDPDTVPLKYLESIINTPMIWGEQLHERIVWALVYTQGKSLEELKDEA